MRALIAYLFVAAVFAQPVWAQNNPKPITFDKETGCWTSISEDYEWKIPIRKSGIFVFISMKNSSATGGETRAPVMWLLGAANDVTPNAENYDDEWMVTHLPKAGNYYLTFAPRAWFGTRGETSVCIRLTKEL